MTLTRRGVSNWFIRIGLFLQVVFLGFVDWGTIVGIRAVDTTPWGHVIGLITVNVLLLVAAFFALKWMRAAQRRQAAPPGVAASVGTDT